MKQTLTWTTLVTLCVALQAHDSLVAGAVDLSTNRTLYTVGYAHLDTQWRWGYPRVISRYIPNTMYDNFQLFAEYPDYIFNFSGAGRYQFMQEYYPRGFAEVQRWAKEGRWFPAGSAWEESDVNVPATESIIRQILYGQRFFEREFGVESCEYMLPDCFGFPASLPSVLAHCGIRGFSTQKLSWGSAIGIPFNVGVWEGLDGESVIAALNPGKYDGDVTENLAQSTNWSRRIQINGERSGLFADYHYYGVGDEGGAPKETSVQWIEKSLASTGAVRVLSTRADQMFHDISDAQKARLPRYKGDLLLTEHSAGSLSSQAYMKRWNRMNETLADAAEKAAVPAHLFGATAYPREKINQAWGLVLRSQMHDMLPGTCLPKAYEYCWNDEVIAMNNFASVLEEGAGGVARALDTQVDGIPLVVFNPLSIEREDVVEVEVELPAGTKSAQVATANGVKLPTQTLAVNGNKHRLLFLGKVPSLGFAVFAVQTSAAANAGNLKVTERSLENARYRVSLNDAGDVASVYDKVASRELLAAPARLAFQAENPRQWPAWNMDWKDRTNAPRSYVSGPATIRVVENGPVRVALEIERNSENSIFVQTVRLAAGEAGNRVEVANRIDWQSRACSLKAEFPLTVANPLATYNWELGKIQRANNDPRKYEVPSHQWFDLTDAKGAYGVTILAPDKYGSDKPADNLLRLTLLYTPGVQPNAAYQEQKHQDWGRHDIVYGIAGHQGDWRNGKSDWEAARLSQPMIAFRTTAHPGKLGREFSLFKTSTEQVAIRTVKLAEDNDQIIVRLQELNGAAVTNVSFTALTGFRKLAEVNGLERKPKALKFSGATTRLDFKPYQMRSLAISLDVATKLTAPVSQSVKLPYNLDAFSSNEHRQDGAFDADGATYPAEMINDVVVADGIKFNIGPRQDRARNVVECKGQEIALPKGKFNRLYLLASSIYGDAEDVFTVDGQGTKLSIQDWSGYIGSWDNRIFQGVVPERTFSVTNPLEGIAPGYIKRDPLAWFCSHRHQRMGNDEVYKYTYIFKYALDLPAQAKVLKLPDNPRIRIFAATAAQNANDATVAAQPLYDDFTGREPVKLRDLN